MSQRKHDDLKAPLKLDGIIGYNFLKQFSVTIDYPNEVLYLR